jgi:hypothetical protein
MPYLLLINNERYKDEVYESISEAIEKAYELAKEESSRRIFPVLSLIRVIPKDFYKIKLFHSNNYEIFLQRV